MGFRKLVVHIGGEETVSGVMGIASSLLTIPFLKTSSAIKSFFLAATLHPEVVRLAQRELDEVLDGERLPDFSDKPRLPYISAIVKEVLRWRPPTPLGIVFLQLSFAREVG